MDYMGLKRTPHLGDSTISTPMHGNSVPSRAYQTAPDVRELVFYDENNPRCVVNLLTPKLKENALKIPPHLLAETDKDIEKRFEPSELDRQLRLAFWDEYFIAQDNNLVRMRPEAIYARLCTREFFYQIVNSELRYAWILKPPTDYMYRMRSLLEIGLNRIHDLLKLPIETEKINSKTNQVYKVVNTKLIAEQIKAIAILDNRVRGAVTQHIKIQSEQKNLHLHAQAPSQTAGNTPYEAPKTHQEILAELKRVNEEIREIAPATFTQLAHGTENILKDTEDELIDVTETITRT